MKITRFQLEELGNTISELRDINETLKDFALGERIQHLMYVHDEILDNEENEEYNLDYLRFGGNI